MFRLKKSSGLAKNHKVSYNMAVRIWDPRWLTMCAVIRAIYIMWLISTVVLTTLWEAINPPHEVKATQGQKPVHYCAKKPATVSQKLTKTRRKAVTEYKTTSGQAPHPHPIHRKVKSRRTNKITTDITTMSPVNEQRSQKIAHRSHTWHPSIGTIVDISHII